MPLHPIMVEQGIKPNSYREMTQSLQLSIDFLKDQTSHHSAPQSDLFAFAFVILSRYEEYIPYGPDVHDRFTANHSILSSLKVLHMPIVDQVLLWFATYVHTNLGITLDLISSQPTEITFDIDHMWKYKNKSNLVTIAGVIKDLCKLDLTALSQRVKTLNGSQQDDYDLDRWKEYIDFSQVVFFILMNQRTKYDKGVDPHHPQFATAVKQLSTVAKIGIHPGYQTSTDYKILSSQVDTYYSLVNARPTRSRQHYLRLKLPTTYRLLLKAGISDDYTMGYADDIGYRAGTCRPFLWYDLQAELSTDLMIHPFAAMDVTLANYLKLTPIESYDQVKKMIQSASKVSGTCRLIWHNSSPFWEEKWKPYRSTFQLFRGSH